MSTIRSNNPSTGSSYNANSPIFATIASIVTLLVAFWFKLVGFADKQRSRRALGRLTDQQLADIGIDRFQAEREATQPFWR